MKRGGLDILVARSTSSSSGCRRGWCLRFAHAAAAVDVCGAVSNGEDNCEQAVHSTVSLKPELGKKKIEGTDREGVRELPETAGTDRSHELSSRTSRSVAVQLSVSAT